MFLLTYLLPDLQVLYS